MNCSAIDAHGNVGSGSFYVTVRDTTAPVVSVPSPITQTATNTSGAIVNFSVSATDIVDSFVQATCAPSSGSLFPVGSTIVNCSATDAQGNTGTASFKVTVVKSSPPPPACLWRLRLSSWLRPALVAFFFHTFSYERRVNLWTRYRNRRNTLPLLKVSPGEGLCRRGNQFG